MRILLFEDAAVEQLQPIVLSKPAYAITCGGARLVDLVAELDAPLGAVVRPHLADWQAHEFPQLQSEDHQRGPCLLVNARLVPSRTSLARLRLLIQRPQATCIRQGDQLAAAWLPEVQDSTISAADSLQYVTEAASVCPPARDLELTLWEYAHDVVRCHESVLREHVDLLVRSGTYRQLADGLFVGSNVQLTEPYHVDTSRGPVVLSDDVRVGAFAVLEGPLLVDRGSSILHHAAIREAVAIGHTCKVGGETECSIIEPFTNKTHHGFLGHSYLGSWVNIGAGTCNSDLKNTYGTVRVEFAGHKLDTGMQFFGAIIGDYTKTAINSDILTGKLIGSCSVLYGTVTSNVAPFVNYAAQLGDITEMSPEVAVTMQRRMFKRRAVLHRPCDAQLIRDMFALSADERAGLTQRPPAL